MGTGVVRTQALWPGGPITGRIGLGCMGMTWAYGDDPHSEDPTEVVARAVGLGMNYLDTAEAYGPYTNEKAVGTAIRRRRERVVIGTKGGTEARHNPDGTPALPVPNGRPERLKRSLDESLRRLGVDHVDIYYLHRPDPDVPLEESIGAIGDMIAAGKAGALGVSELTVEQLERAHSVHPVKAVQSELSLWSRDHLATTLPWCARTNAAFIAYAPLGRGFLTGSMREDHVFVRNDFRATLPRFQSGNRAANLAIVERIEAIAQRHHATAAQVAIAWTLAQGTHVVPIPGTRRCARVSENAAADQLQLTTADLTALDQLPSPAQTRT